MADLQICCYSIREYVARAAKIPKPYKIDLLKWRKIHCSKILWRKIALINKQLETKC